MNRGELKSEAKTALKAYLMQLILVGLCTIIIATVITIVMNIISGIIIGVTTVIFKKGLVVSLVSMVMSLITFAVIFAVSAITSVGMVRASQAALDGKAPGFSDLTSILSDGSLGLATKTLLLTYVRVFLWSLLFVIPGIIKSYSYSMVPFILAENPDMTPSEIISMSCDMMRGHKIELFVLILSFIGWYFLAILCCGLGLIILIPYVMLTMTAYYSRLSTEFR